MVRPAALLAVAAALALAACAPKPSDRSCPSGQERCNGACVDPATYATDPASCGGCGAACAAGASCTSGACACPAGQVDCNGACVDPATWAADRENCGGCGIACGVGTCAGGVCDCGAFTACTTGTPRCVDGLTDPDHCGRDAATACVTACTVAGETCAAGTCACPAGTTGCPETAPTACVNRQSDAANCGTCGARCATGQTCVSGTCECPAGESVCGDACVNRQSDEANCGTCGTVCAAGATCGAGTCACPSAQPTVCGIASASAGTCCAGKGCCTPPVGGPSTCQTEHSNGLGQSFYDCLALGTHTLAQAENAAAAWQPSGTEQAGVEFGCSGCIGWHATVNQTSWCGTWCYSGTLAGRAMSQQSLLCGCPFGAAQTWN